MNIIPPERIKNRIFGLDVLRFAAIFFVMLGHSCILLPQEYKKAVYPFVLDGVSIFFVLSGFLIGGIIIKQFNKAENSLSDLFAFWKKRWLRTLPAYFIVLSILISYTLILKAERIPDQVWKYYLFIQNFLSPQPAFFSESWSLSIEEWFYLLIPLLIWLGTKIWKFRITLLIIMIACILFSCWLRYYRYETMSFTDLKSVDLNIYRQVLTRMDAILFGVIGAYVAYFHPDFWRKSRFIAIGLLIVSFPILRMFVKEQVDFFTIVFFPALKSLAILFILPLFSLWKSAKGMLPKAITYVSIISYSLYLINRTIGIDIVIKYGFHENLRDLHQADQNWVFEYLVFWIASLLLASLSYRFIEHPFMNFRKQHHEPKKTPH